MGGTPPIASIGMAGRFPGSRDVDEFWDNLAAGRDCLTVLTDGQLLAVGESAEMIAKPNDVRRRPLLADTEGFDARLFDMPPREAEIRDPQYRLLLETVHATFLVAVHVARVALRAGDCDMAVAGGVDIEFPYNRGYPYVPGGIAARDGVPRSFDRGATGTNFGNGVGTVLLKPLAAALADGDTVHEAAGADEGDPVAGELRELWTAALGVTDIGPDDDFFAVVGSSMAAVQLIARIKERFQVELSVGDMLEMSTIRAVAAVRLGAGDAVAG